MYVNFIIDLAFVEIFASEPFFSDFILAGGFGCQI